MNEEYPYPCCRCGFCCLIEQCPISIMVHGETEDVCPSLFFDGEETTCRLANEFVPVGQGCCMSARAYHQGVKFDFSSLPEVMKIKIAQNLKKEKGV